MGRPRTATNILEAKGAFKINPERKRPGEPKTGKFDSTPPEYFDADHIAVWDELVNMIPAGVLTSSDLIQVEMLTNLIVDYRKDPDKFPTQRLGRMSTEMHKLGLNPSGRASLIVEKHQENEFD